MMSSSLRPAFGPVLLDILNKIPRPPPDPALAALSAHEIVLKTREYLAPQWDPATVFTDPDILHEELTCPGPAGDIALTVVRSKNSAGGPRPVIYWMHGGGMKIGSRLFGLGVTFPFVKELDVVLMTVEYRLAPENPAPTQVEDCSAGLIWVADNASQLGVDPGKIIVSGSSAGGGLAAGCALLGRDAKGPSLLGQMLLNPMLDDRNKTLSSKQYESEGLLTGKANVASWDMILPGTRGSEGVSKYVAPSRAEDLSGLPPTYLDSGDAEPFRDEIVAYASKLWEGGVNAELHIWPGA